MGVGSPTDKPGWRAGLLARRHAVPAEVRAREARQLADAVLALCGRLPPGAVCGYVPVGTEPGSPAVLDAVRATGREVLVPLVPAGTGSAAVLGWARYLGEESLVDGPYGLRQPVGPDLGAAALARAAMVLVPALAVDRHGVRLGRGAGWYDRSLPLARPGTPLLAVVRDDEVVATLPREPHDVPMTGVLTPSGGASTLPPGLL